MALDQARAARMLAATFLLATGAVSAATLTVPTQHPSIQAAVDAAVAGDTIVVRSGTYYENVAIPAGKDGLVLRAKGIVTLDARPAGQMATGPGITIDSDAVTLRGLRIRHAATGANGVGVLVAANAVVLDKLSVRRCSNAGIRVTGDDAVIVKCLLRDNESGIQIVGNDAFVRQCTIANDGNDGIQISGNDAVVSKCVISQIEDGEGVNVTGSNLRIESCVIRHTDGPGIRAAGSGLVRQNKVESIATNDAGILVESATGELEVQNNAVRRTSGPGIDVRATAPGATLRANVVSDCGVAANPCILLASANTVAEKNVVRRSADDGIRVATTATDNELSGNLAQSCGEDGLDVEGAGCDVVGNKAIGNHAEGIEINASGTLLTNNAMAKNRTDLASDGAFIAVPTGNVFASGGAGTPPEIDD